MRARARRGADRLGVSAGAAVPRAPIDEGGSPGRTAARQHAAEQRLADLVAWPAGRPCPRWRWLEGWVVARCGPEAAAQTGTREARWAQQRHGPTLDAAVRRWDYVVRRATDLEILDQIRVAGWGGPTLAALPSRSATAGWAVWLEATRSEAALEQVRAAGWDARAWAQWTREMVRQLHARDPRRQMRRRRRAQQTLEALEPAQPSRIAYRRPPCDCGDCRRCRRQRAEHREAAEARAVLRRTRRTAELRAAGLDDRAITQALIHSSSDIVRSRPVPHNVDSHRTISSTLEEVIP